MTDPTGTTGRTGTDGTAHPRTDHAPSADGAALWAFEHEAPIRDSELPFDVLTHSATAVPSTGVPQDSPFDRGGGWQRGAVGSEPAGGGGEGREGSGEDEYGRARAPRSDAGQVRLSVRDVAALLLIGEMYGLQSDHLEQVLRTSSSAVRQVTMRWRKAGLVETGRLGVGPGWCWLTKRGIDWCGLGYTARRPTLSRLGHIRAGVAVRLALEAWPVYRRAGGAWRSERRLRALHGAGPGGGAGTGGVGRYGHVPDAEILWQGNTDRPEADGPEVADGHLAGQIWAVEVELTPKAGTRTSGVMAQLLGRTGDYGEPPNRLGGTPRYARVLYVVSAAARATVEAARASLPAQAADRIEIQPLPAGAVLLGAAPNDATNDGESGL
ncbi:hypothetical protein [Tenggerimyces flavus]|uniref:Replication-relaxation n=1 Tax=Tenggerimyces flavus TaxID=1708749 RepID=A0ABV7YP41_9ACTN|nr:hypothetical protein [Tenggerimyces flavus]MBM7784897.1 hypothetical protein [Tenggerimyces flavus]